MVINKEISEFELTPSFEREVPQSNEVVDVHLRNRLVDYLTIHGEVQRRHANVLDEDTTAFLSRGFFGVLDERNQTAEDTKSPEVQEAVSIANELFPYRPYGVFCIDGRIKRRVVYGFVLGTSGFIHVPAGRLSEFKDTEGTELVLEPNSYYARLIDKSLEEADTVVTAQLRDAHQGCAAEEQKQKRETNLGQDGGLYDNIVRMFREAESTREYVDNNHPLKRIDTIITSYDPNHNTLIIGLERVTALMRASKLVEQSGGYFPEGYTPEVLEELAQHGEIINTASFIAEGSPFRRYFETYQIENFDWVNNFKENINSFWKNMRTMKSEGLIEDIKTVVREVYNNNGMYDEAIRDEALDDDAIEERAVLLAANAYSAFLTKGEYATHHGHVAHRENVVSFVEAENGPYGRFRSFVVNPRIVKDFARNTLLANDILNGNVGWNGREPTISDPTGAYQSPEDYKHAPKIGYSKEVVRADIDWDEVRRRDWKDLPSDWAEMSIDDFESYVLRKFGDIMIATDFKVFFNAVENARQIAKNLNESDSELHDLMHYGKFVVMPTIVDRYRKIQTIIPFIPRGSSLL